MHDAYEDAIERIESQNKGDRALAKQVLSWMTYAKQLLTVNGLQHAIAVEVETPELDMEFAPPNEDTITVCAGLLILDQESNSVRLVHYAAQEYLENIRSSWLPEAQEYIPKTCLTYLSSEF